MNVIKLMGGQGNQFFQFAFGAAMMLKGIDVKFDLSWYSSLISLARRYPRPYVLDKYITQLVEVSKFLNQETIKENDIFDINNINKVNCNFDGYWQYLPYFKEIIPNLRRHLILKQEFETSEFLTVKNYINSVDSIGIHIRRGDYLNQKGWGVLPLRYYYLALQQLKGTYFIFSDDLEYARKVFDQRHFENKLVFVKMSEAYLDFELLRACKHQIIANSTFSYWAALLNDHSQKKVVCPSHWLGEPKADEYEMHYPKQWIKIYDYAN